MRIDFARFHYDAADRMLRAGVRALRRDGWDVDQVRMERTSYGHWSVTIGIARVISLTNGHANPINAVQGGLEGVCGAIDRWKAQQRPTVGPLAVGAP